MAVFAPAFQYKATDIKPFSVLIQIVSYKKEKAAVLWLRTSFVTGPLGIQWQSVGCTLEDKQKLKQKARPWNYLNPHEL